MQVVNDTRTAAGVVAATAGTKAGTIFDIIPDDIGKFGLLVGAILTMILIVIHLIRLRIVINNKSISDNREKLSEIDIEIAELKPTTKEPKLIPIFSYDYKKQKLKRTKNASLIMQEIKKTSNLTTKNLQTQLKQKQKQLEQLVKLKPNINEFLEICAGVK